MFSREGCYIGTSLEQESAFWLAESGGDYEAVNRMRQLGQAFVVAQEQEDASAMEKINVELQKLLAHASKMALN